MKLTTLLLTAIMPFAFTSCGDEEKPDTPKSVTTADLEFVLLKEKPTEFISIADIRTKHKAGDKVTFSGQVIGAHQVLIKDRSLMIMGDPTKMTTCDLRPGDNCKFPWDVCCDDRDVVKANIVTVQILDKEGKVFKTGIRNPAGIKEMSHLVITGEIDKASNEKNMIVNATGVYVDNKK